MNEKKEMKKITRKSESIYLVKFEKNECIYILLKMYHGKYEKRCTSLGDFIVPLSCNVERKDSGWALKRDMFVLGKFLDLKCY